MTKYATLREELISELRDARIEHDRARNLVASPYSGHDALVDYHYRRGIWSGIARAIEVIDGLEEASS